MPSTYAFYCCRGALVHLLMQCDLKLYAYTGRLRNLVILTLSVWTASRKLNSNRIEGMRKALVIELLQNSSIEENLSWI